MDARLTTAEAAMAVRLVRAYRVHLARTSTLLAIGTVLALGITEPAYAKHKTECSLEILEGSYGYFLSGNLNGVGPVGAVGLAAFDGEGGLTAQDTLNINGVTSHRTGTGSYAINPNCTGSAKVDGDYAGFAFDFMIVPGAAGSEFTFIVTNPRTIQTGFAMRTGDECTLASLKGTYRVLGGEQPFAAVGLRILDGAGSLTSAEDTVSMNGVISHRIGRSAAYTVEQNCTAHEIFADGPTFEGVIVAGGAEAYFLRTNGPAARVGTALYKKRSRHHDDD